MYIYFYIITICILHRSKHGLKYVLGPYGGWYYAQRWKFWKSVGGLLGASWEDTVPSTIIIYTSRVFYSPLG